MRWERCPGGGNFNPASAERPFHIFCSEHPGYMLCLVGTGIPTIDT